MRSLFTLMILLLFSTVVLAGNGIIAGKVTDEKTGEAIIGATIVTANGTIGTVTDVDGQYQVSAPPGTYTVQVKYIGYKTKEISEVTVADGNTISVNAVIGVTKANSLDEVVVRSTLKKENINALYTVQKTSAAISDGISADIIKKSPDRSTGEVLKRVSGTTIQDNKFVIVRGLSDRYNVAMVDNAILPSTEPNRKAFSFDIIPATLIDNIVITKAATPDLPGDFAGGAINILTREIPEQNFATLSLGLSYNMASTGKNFKSGYRTSTDFLGFDNGTRQLNPNFLTADYIQHNSLSAAQSISNLTLLNNDFAIRQHKASPGVGFQAAMGQVYRLKNSGRFGITAAVTFSHTETIKNDVVRQYDNYDFTDNSYLFSSNLGALLNFGYSKGKSKILLKTLYNRIFDDQFLYREGVNYSGPRDVRYYAYDLVQKSLLKTSLEGSTQIGAGQKKLDWLLGYNLVSNNQPDQRKVSYGRATGTTDGFTADNTSLGRANNRLFGDMKENILNAQANYSMPVSMFNKSTLKVGAFGLYRSRSFSNRYLGAVLDPLVPVDVAADVRSSAIGDLYNQNLINSGIYYLNDLTTPGDQYDATATTAAGYAMLDNKLTENFRIVWGARVENYALGIDAAAKSVSRTWTDVLPSANLTYALNAQSNLRASYFRSVARPEMREIAGDLLYYDYELNANLTGNYDLQRGLIDNIDLRYEIYPEAGEILSASVFYKNFNQTIENSFYGINSSYEIKPQNYKQANVTGVELEIRKNLGSIGKADFWKHLNYYANLAYIQSKVNLEGEDRNYVGNTTRDFRPLSGQSPYVINTSLGYTALENKLAINVLYNRIGQRIFLVGGQRFGDAYESARNLMDFQASWTMSRHHEIRLYVKDIFNAPVEFYFDQNDNKKFDGSGFKNGVIDPTNDWVQQRYRPGTTYALTYTFRF